MAYFVWIFLNNFSKLFVFLSRANFRGFSLSLVLCIVFLVFAQLFRNIRRLQRLNVIIFRLFCSVFFWTPSYLSGIRFLFKWKEVYVCLVCSARISSLVGFKFFFAHDRHPCSKRAGFTRLVIFVVVGLNSNVFGFEFGASVQRR